jgi:hypothetical protein
MSKAKETLMFLANYNSWRRDGETKDMPSPTEIGAAIDDAVNLLRKYDELERENAALRADKERLDWLLKEGEIRWPHENRAAIDRARKEQP